MARHAVMVCDLCGEPTEKLVGKISFCPTIKGVVNLNWNNYTHTADVGECCKDDLFKQVKFRKRMTQEQYQQSRRDRANKSTTRARRTKESRGDALAASEG